MIKSKIAQARVYLTSLSEEQLLYIQLSASCKLTLAALVSVVQCHDLHTRTELTAGITKM